MSVFEDKIKRNKHHFDHKSPEAGHTDRFMSKLDQHLPQQRRVIGRKIILQIAAGLVLLVAAGYTLGFLLIERHVSDETTVYQIQYPDELSEVLAYYDELSLEKVNAIDYYISDNEKAKQLKKEAIHRLNDIDGSMAAIEKEYIKNPENKNIKATLVNVKRKKVEVMDDILTQLDFANTSLF